MTGAPPPSGRPFALPSGRMDRIVIIGCGGSGKTVVALHRTAYLLYADPRLGHRRGGVLFVGPHRQYLSYVVDVLPSLGEEGVLAMVCDSTNALVEGHSGSEAEVRRNLAAIVKPLKGRVAVTCFATNIARVESIARAAEAAGRQVSLFGRSLRNAEAAARECGYLRGLAPFVPEEEAGGTGWSRVALEAAHLGWVAGVLALIDAPFRIEQPDALRAEVRALAARLAERVADPA